MSAMHSLRAAATTQNGLLVKLAVAAVVFAVLPFVISPFAAGNILLLTIVAIGYNLLLGYGGELSFGHAALYGGGAYMTVLWSQVVPNLYIAILLAVLTVTAGTVVMAMISLRRRGLYFAMITLALAQMVYVAVNQSTEIAGGANGLVLPLQPGSAAIGPLAPLQSQWDFYLIGLVVLALVYVAVYRVTKSPYGRALKAISEGEDRARHLGYPINRMLLISFTMSGALAGLAGGMHAALFTFISPGLLFWSFSGEIVLVAIMGGIGTLGGPVVGAVIFGIVADQLPEYTANWPIFYGLLFVVIVMVAPQGIYGLIKQLNDEEENPSQDIREVIERLIRG